MKNKIKGLSLIALTTIVPIYITFADEVEEDAITKTIDEIIEWLSLVGGGLATLAIVIAGIMMVMSNEKEDNVNKAKEIIKWAGVGLVVILLANALTTIIKGLVIKG